MRFLSLLLAACLLLPFCASRAEEDYTPSVEGIKTGVVNARVGVHDPSIIAADGSYYIFGSHMASAKSDNLRTWTVVASGYYSGNKVWGDLFAENTHVFDYAGGPSSLIPTDDGQYHVSGARFIFHSSLQ